MTEQGAELRHMLLGQTDGFRYIGIKPGLSLAEIEHLPVPEGLYGYEDIFISYVADEDDGSTSIGFNDFAFCENENIHRNTAEGSLFVQYAKKFAAKLGHVSLDKTVRYVGPGSLFNPRFFD